MAELLDKILSWIIEKKVLVIGVFLTIILLSFVLFSHHGIIKRIKLESQKSVLAERIKLEHSNNDSLKIEHKKLSNDLIEIERIAREKYGMLRPEEEVYFVRKK